MVGSKSCHPRVPGLGTRGPARRELTAANSVGSTIESVGCVASPALAAGLLALASPALVFAVAAAAALAAGCSTIRIRAARPSARRPPR